MDRARRVTHQNQAAVGVAAGLDHRQWIMPAGTGQLERAVAVTEPVGELADEVLIVECDQLAREPVVRRPDDRGAIAEHRQHGKRAGGEEALERAPAVRLGMGDRRDDAGLPVIPARHPDAGEVAQGRFPPVGGREQAGADALPAGECQVDRLRPALDPLPALRRCDFQRASAQLGDAAQQRAPDHAVLDDVPERLAADRPMVVVYGERRMSLADLDVQDRLSVGDEVGPDPDGFEQMS